MKVDIGFLNEFSTNSMGLYHYYKEEKAIFIFFPSQTEFQ